MNSCKVVSTVKPMLAYNIYIYNDGKSHTFNLAIIKSSPNHQIKIIVNISAYTVLLIIDTEIILLQMVCHTCTHRMVSRSLLVLTNFFLKIC